MYEKANSHQKCTLYAEACSRNFNTLQKKSNLVFVLKRLYYL